MTGTLPAPGLGEHFVLLQQLSPFCLQDEFHIYSWKKVTWISLPALDHSVLADQGSLLNKVIMKPELKVSSNADTLDWVA